MSAIRNFEMDYDIFCSFSLCSDTIVFNLGIALFSSKSTSIRLSLFSTGFNLASNFSSIMLAIASSNSLSVISYPP